MGLWDPKIDTSKAEHELGFKPLSSQEGFANTLKYMEDHGFIRPTPQPDAGAVACSVCSNPFSSTRRRHHCRQCGSVICRACSCFDTIPKLGYKKSVRRCAACVKSVD